MLRLIIMIVFILWCLKKLKNFTDIDLVNGDSPQEDTITINEYEEVKSQADNNIDNLKELKGTIKNLIISQLEKENVKEVKKLLYQLEVVIDKIQEQSENNELLSVKAKNISKKLLDKVDGYLD